MIGLIVALAGWFYHAGELQQQVQHNTTVEIELKETVDELRIDVAKTREDVALIRGYLSANGQIPPVATDLQNRVDWLHHDVVETWEDIAPIRGYLATDRETPQASLSERAKRRAVVVAMPVPVPYPVDAVETAQGP